MGIKNYSGLVCFIVFLIATPALIGTDSYLISVLIFMGIHCLIAIGLSLLMGYAGQISLGHGAFFGLGAYASGLLTTLLEINPWLAMLLALGITCIIALVIGLPCLRLSGHYLAMATLAFGEIINIFMNAQVELTGGPAGFAGIPMLAIGSYEVGMDLQLGPLSMGGDLVYYSFVWLIVVLVLFLVLNMIHSRVGRALHSIHGGEQAANALGVNTTFYKVQVFVLSAGLASVAGSLYAHYMSFLSPSACDLKLSVMLVVMVAVGGMANVWGALLGTIFMTALPEFLNHFEEMGFLKEDADFLVYGMILMVIMIFMPDGLFVTIGKVAAKCRQWVMPKEGGVSHGRAA
jgi:branched-chain amino acid transport system permease protein